MSRKKKKYARVIESIRFKSTDDVYGPLIGVGESGIYLHTDQWSIYNHL